MAASAQQVTFLPIKEISAYQTRFTIKARITSKSQLRPFGKDGDGRVFQVELLDNEGGDIRASFFRDAAVKFFEKLEVNKVYRFSNGTAKVANKQYNNTSSKYELSFGSDAQIEEVVEAEVYKAAFNFTDIQSALSKPMPCRVDLCGVVTSFRPSSSVTAKDGRELTKREITIVDDTSASMDLTLWGEHAKVSDSCFEGKPVVAFKNIGVREWNGVRSGGTIDSSAMEFRPDLPEAKRVEKWWSLGGQKQSFANLVDIGSIQSKVLPCRVDVAGIITRFDPIKSVKAKDGRELTKREITIADRSGLSLDVTLWGSLGQAKESDFEGNPTIVLTHILVKEWNGGRSGSTLDSSVVDLNPVSEKAESLKRWWSQEGGSTQTIATLSVKGGGGGVAKNAEECTLSEVRQKVDVVTEQVEHYKVVARLALVQTRKQGEQVALHYNSCAEVRESQYGQLTCKRRVDESGFCPACNRAGKTEVRLNMRCKFADSTDSAWLTTFHEAAEVAISMAGEKMSKIDADSRDQLEGILRRKYFMEPLELILRARLESYNGEPRANVSCVTAVPVNPRVHGRKLLSEVHSMLLC